MVDYDEVKKGAFIRPFSFFYHCNNNIIYTRGNTIMEGTSTSNAVQINHYSFIAMQQFFLANPELIEKSYLYFNNNRNTLCVCIGATIGDKNEPTVIIIDCDSDCCCSCFLNS